MSLPAMRIAFTKALKLWTPMRWSHSLAAIMSHRRTQWVGLAAILIVAALFRLTGLNWDQNQHLHPDERFLTSVTNDMTWPDSFDTYFDPTTSPLSPYALPDTGLYVYGTLPVYLVKWIAVALDRNDYDQIALVGRVCSSLFDIGTIIFLFLIGRRLYDEKIALLGAALLSISVLNIQLAHFFAVDTFATFFVVATIYFVLRASASGSWWHYALIGASLGLGMASKISVLTLAVPILIGVGLDFRRRLQAREQATRAFEQTLARLVMTVALAALIFRVLQPIAFEGPSFWNWSLNPRWLRDVAEQKDMSSGNADNPSIQQWVGTRSILFPLQNIVQWGMGVPLGLAAWVGWGLAAFELLRRRKLVHLLPVVYIGLIMLYHGTVFVKFMRYFLPIYPFLALLAAYFIIWVWRRAAAYVGNPTTATQGRTARMWAYLQSQHAAIVLAGVVVGGTLLYALAFISIYSRPHSRIEASRWLYTNAPPGAVLATESWDDALPLDGLDGKSAFGENGMYTSIEMPLYDDDTLDKLNLIIDNLSKADYLILSSNRLYGSIPRLPLRYPMAIRYYELLFDGELGFTKVAEFTSYPQLFGISIPDQSAEESFSVYDHPRVQIFKKNADFNPDALRLALGGGIDWDAVLHLTPHAANAAPSGLMLTQTEQEIYSQTAALNTDVSANSWGNQLPLVAWIVALEVLGQLALPLTLLTFGKLADRGVIFAKMIGLLLIGWVVWLAASFRLLTFTWPTIIIAMVLMGVVAWLLTRSRRAELRIFARQNRRLRLIQEGLFWTFFLVGVFLRWRNPDLWHPSMGGEKPMDLAYLTAVVRTPYFPSYDPWFAGGYINYYYFGFVLISVLVHLTGIEPQIAYNLAVPTLFAMTAMGAFSVVYNLAEGWQRRGAGAALVDAPRPNVIPRGPLVVGVFGALFVAVIGNLGELQLIVKGLQDLSSISEGIQPFFLPFVKAFDGLYQLVTGGGHLNFSIEWWYWNATRVIPGGPDEAGPINEFPFFTFLFADLHAHMMALPYTLLALALGVNIIRDTSPNTARPTERLSLIARIRHWDLGEVLTLGLLALTLGALWPINTWDVPTYMLLTGMALVLRAFARRGRFDVTGLWSGVWRWMLVVVGGYILFLPFQRNYAGTYFGAEPWHGSRTPLWAYLIIHGFFLFILVSYLVTELLWGRDHNAFIRSFALVLRRPRRFSRAIRLQRLLVHPSSLLRLGWQILRFSALVIVGLLIGHMLYGLLTALILLTGLLLFTRRPDARRQFVLCLIGLGFALTLMVELIVLNGDIDRMNTVFKFYLQVWVMWAVASAVALPLLSALIRPRLRRRRASATEVPTLLLPRQTALRTWGARTWWGVFGLLLAACLLYPICATPARLSDRFDLSNKSTLDGQAYMSTSVYNNNGQDIQLYWDRQAIGWLQNTVHDLPVIVEANGPLYTWNARVAINTGLPSVIGWDWHQKQQRSILSGDIIDRRIQDVNTIYTSTDIDEVQRLLDHYNVRYIYVGQLEQDIYGSDALQKFSENQGKLWDLAYENEQVKIYKVR